MPFNKDAFMHPVVYEGNFWEIDGDDCVEWIDSDTVPYSDELANMECPCDLVDTPFRDYCSSKRAFSIDFVHGWGAYMSAPGYMDRTDLYVLDSESEAIEFLEEYYGDDDEEEDEEDEEEYYGDDDEEEDEEDEEEED